MIILCFQLVPLPLSRLNKIKIMQLKGLGKSYITFLVDHWMQTAVSGVKEHATNTQHVGMLILPLQFREDSPYLHNYKRSLVRRIQVVLAFIQMAYDVGRRWI